MKTEIIPPPRKACGNSLLKSLAPEKQADIAKHALEHTLEQTQAYLASQHQIQCCLMTISRFREWYQGGTEARLNYEKMAGVSAEVAAQHPEWTPEKVRAVGQAYFSAYAIRHDNVRAWWQIQQLALKREKLDLEQEKDVRNTCEWVLTTLKDPKIQAKVYDDSKSYAEKIKQLRIVMFGDGDEEETPNPKPQTPEKHQTPSTNLTADTSHLTPAANIQHSREERANIQQPTSNIQHPVAEKTQNEAPTAKLQAPEKLQTSNTNLTRDPAAAGHLTPLKNIQPSTLSSQPSEVASPPLKRSPLSYEAATKVVEGLALQAIQAGYTRPKRREVAALRAYLTGQDIKWFDEKHRREIMHPPALDPRLDPESWWGKVCQHLQALGQCENN